VHLLIWPHQNTYDIARILNDTKGRMAKQYRDYILENESENFERHLIDIRQKQKATGIPFLANRRRF
jgi:hypothetical protein